MSSSSDHGITVFRRRAERTAFIVVLLAVLLVLVASGFFLGDPMVGTGLIGVVVAFAVFLAFADRVPRAFALLAMRGVVVPEDDDRFVEFQRTVTDAMNGRGSTLLGGIGVLVGLAYFPIRAGGVLEIFGSGPGSLAALGPLGIGALVGLPVLWYLAGVAIWRMLIVGLKIDELGRRFALQVQLGHPDGCGGFEPLGNLSLWNALILAVPGLFLGWWIAIGPSSQYGTRWVAFDSVLAFVVVVLASIAFIGPLWNVHRSMARSADQLRAEIERRGREIDRLARELMASDHALTPEVRAQKAKDLELQQELYRNNQQIPTWPINVSLAAKFGSSQLVPLLGLTGLSKPIVDAVQRLSDFLAGG